MRLTEEGKYQAKVAGAYLAESQHGTVGVVFEFACQEGTIECTRWATPRTADRLWQDLETLGFTRKHAEDMDNLDRIEEITLGHQCQIVCEFEEYNGEKTLRVRWINGTGGMRSIKPQTKAGLHAILMGNSITGPAMVSAPRHASAPRHMGEPPPNSPLDEDVPF